MYIYYCNKYNCITVVVFAVVTMVIKPLLRTQKEINGIIVNIDNKKGDLTQRVTPINKLLEG